MQVTDISEVSHITEENLKIHFWTLKDRFFFTAEVSNIRTHHCASCIIHYTNTQKLIKVDKIMMSLSFGTLLLYFSGDTRVDKNASDSLGQKSLTCWMWTTTVSAALGNKYCDVRQTIYISLSLNSS